jgi:hypothetical protein
MRRGRNGRAAAEDDAISRPSNRWKYSHQKMPLNSPTDMPLLTCWYSGVARYLAKASSHCASVNGGSVPTIGCHSVIDKPEWVRRVTPPTTTIANTSAQQRKSHAATARCAPLPAAGAGCAPAGAAATEAEGSFGKFCHSDCGPRPRDTHPHQEIPPRFAERKNS